MLPRVPRDEVDLGVVGRALCPVGCRPYRPVEGDHILCGVVAAPDPVAAVEDLTVDGALPGLGHRLLKLDHQVVPDPVVVDGGDDLDGTLPDGRPSVLPVEREEHLGHPLPCHGGDERNLNVSGRSLHAIQESIDLLLFAVGLCELRHIKEHREPDVGGGDVHHGVAHGREDLLPLCRFADHIKDGCESIDILDRILDPAGLFHRPVDVLLLAVDGVEAPCSVDEVLPDERLVFRPDRLKHPLGLAEVAPGCAGIDPCHEAGKVGEHDRTDG